MIDLPLVVDSFDTEDEVLTSKHDKIFKSKCFKNQFQEPVVRFEFP